MVVLAPEARSAILRAIDQVAAACGPEKMIKALRILASDTDEGTAWRGLIQGWPRWRRARDRVR